MYVKNILVLRVTVSVTVAVTVTVTVAVTVVVKVLEKCRKNLIGHSRLAFNNHESNIDC